MTPKVAILGAVAVLKQMLRLSDDHQQADQVVANSRDIHSLALSDKITTQQIYHVFNESGV